MDYHPGVFALGRRDVIAAWFFLMAVAAVALFIDPGASAGDNAAVAESPAKQHEPAATLHDGLCLSTGATATHRG